VVTLYRWGAESLPAKAIAARVPAYSYQFIRGCLRAGASSVSDLHRMHAERVSARKPHRKGAEPVIHPKRQADPRIVWHREGLA
jgi:hypothetical protein